MSQRLEKPIACFEIIQEGMVSNGRSNGGADEKSHKDYRQNVVRPLLDEYFA